LTKNTETVDRLDHLLVEVIDLMEDRVRYEGLSATDLELIKALPEMIKTIEKIRDLIDWRERRKEPVDYTECLAKCEE